MLLKFLLFSAGVLLTGSFPALPSLTYLSLFIPLFLLILIRRARRFVSYLLVFVLGIAWGVYSGHQILASQLTDGHSGKTFLLTGTISGLPKRESKQIRFWLDVKSLRDQQGNEIQDSKPDRVQLSWYFRSQDSMPTLQTGDQWQLSVKLHRPRSFVNPAGFDYQLWLLRKGVGATGYVIKGENRPLPMNDKDFSDAIEIWRYQLQRWVIQHSDSQHKGILAALLIGDSTEVEKDHWQIMQKTGTNHLIAISGLHVGFLAIVGFYLGLTLGRLLQLVRVPFPAQFFGYIAAMIFAGFYSALAGFNIPTVRTLLMLSIFYWICLQRQDTQFIRIFCLALVLVVIVDPLAAYDMGFWLSFGAVALLLMGFSGRLSLPTALSARQKFRQIVWDYCRSQWLMLVGLLVPLIIFISSFSLASPIANALAIPVITFMVVPCLLLAAVLDSLIPGWGQGLLNIAAMLLDWLLNFLRALLNLFPFEANPLIDLTPAMMMFLAFCCLLLLLPKGFFSRSVSATFLILSLSLVMTLPKPDQPDLKLLVMDVGQGTAVVVQVKDKTLVYDTGAKFSDNFDAGSGILAPYLRSRAIRQLDILVVSHNDQDHAGGLEGLLANISVGQLLLGQYQPVFQPTRIQQALYQQANHVNTCHEFPAWSWHQVSFRFITWPLRYRASANNYSCVLEITYLNQIILLPGDLEREVESQLLSNHQLPKNIQLLLAGHHGSQTSSSLEFVKQLRPAEVVYSAGYHNRYGHPHKSVRKRFQSIGANEFNTAEQGALEFSWKNGVNQPVLIYRDLKRRYWH